MQAHKNANLSNCLGVVSLIGFVWAIVAFIVSLALAGAEDNMDMSVPVPSWLKALYEVLHFPALQVLPWDWLAAHLGEPAAAMIEVFGTVIVGFAWGFCFVSLYSLTKRFFTKKLQVARQSISRSS